MSRSAFSLVEVLIAIVVLALGLLGVAAVFPAVLSQQRAATDAVMGDSVSESAGEIITESRTLNEPTVTDARGVHPRGWRLLTANFQKFSPVIPALGALGYYDGDWQDINTVVGRNTPMALDKSSGTMRITGTDGTPAEVPLIQRLSPTPYSSGAQPQYVWDFAARRVGAGVRPDFVNSQPTVSLATAAWDDDVQVVVFVRRVDTGIRRPPKATLADVLTGFNLQNSSDRRLPVAADTSGRPTYDGMGDMSPNYSQIQRVECELPMDPVTNRPIGDKPIIDPNNTALAVAQYAKAIGQKLVDPFGVIHEVRDVLRDQQTQAITALVISPQVDPDLYQMWVSSAGTPFRMLFTPQIPAAVSIINIHPADPVQAN